MWIFWFGLNEEYAWINWPQFRECLQGMHFNLQSKSWILDNCDKLPANDKVANWQWISFCQDCVPPGKLDLSQFNCKEIEHSTSTPSFHRPFAEHFKYAA
jgi:hypothetical protein